MCHFFLELLLSAQIFSNFKARSWFGMENLICWPLFLPNRWVRFGKDLELLDSPGILPMRISDQSAAIKLAICDDIGERSYDVVDVAAILVQMLTKLPSIGTLQYFIIILIAIWLHFVCNVLGSCFPIYLFWVALLLQVQKLFTIGIELTHVATVVKRMSCHPCIVVVYFVF